MIISVVGTGYVGLITGICFATLGFRVNCIDRDKLLCAQLSAGIPTIHEDGLGELLTAVREKGTIRFTSCTAAAVSESDMVFVAVGTPMGLDGKADLTALEGCITQIAPHLNQGATVVIKSTVPVGTNARVSEMIAKLRPGLVYSVASNPEFLREGSAIADFMNADRIVCGIRGEAARDRFVRLYRPLVERGSVLAFTTPENAELSKYASNAFLAAKITFINEIADLCETSGGDVDHVSTLMGIDKRIGGMFLQAGPGYGGSCFPKDTAALAAAAASRGVELSIVKAAIAANTARQRRLAAKVIDSLARQRQKRVAVLGVAFKAGTDDVRDSPAISFISSLKAHGATVYAHDPEARKMGECLIKGVQWCDGPLEAAAGAHAVVLLTDWPQYAALNMARLADAMEGNLVFDFRNVLSPEAAVAAGLDYQGVGLGNARRCRLKLLDAKSIEAEETCLLEEGLLLGPLSRPSVPSASRPVDQHAKLALTQFR